MAQYVKVRGLERAGVRVGKKTVTNKKTSYFDLDNAVTRQSIARHSAIGKLVVFGSPTTVIASGAVASAGTTLSYSVTAGTLGREDGAVIAIAAVLNQALTAADVTNPRVDLIHVDNVTGVVAKTDGTAAATAIPPLLPAGKTQVATVRVAAGATAAVGTTYTDVGQRL